MRYTVVSADKIHECGHKHLTVRAAEKCRYDLQHYLTKTINARWYMATIEEVS